MNSSKDKMIAPDFKGGSIVNLMSSILKGHGAHSDYAPLSLLNPAEASCFKNVILLVLDGLGYNYVMANGQGTLFKKHLRGSMTSVFPSTTATAITSFLTGDAPGEHGVTAWYVYLKELGMVTRILPFTSRFGHLDLRSSGVDPKMIFSAEPVFKKIRIKSFALNHLDLAKSEYNLANNEGARVRGYKTLKDLFEEIIKIAKGSKEKRYISAYWGKFDESCHKTGVKSRETKKHFKELGRELDNLAKALAGTDSLVIVTADHGLINVKKSERIYLEDHPRWAETLTLPLCGEPRVAYCYVRPGKTKQFEEYVKDRLGKYCALYKSEDLVKSGWFGMGEKHSRLNERIGDYTLIMKDNYVILDRVLGGKEVTHIGFHGGTSAEEMLVPLVVIPC